MGLNDPPPAPVLVAPAAPPAPEELVEILPAKPAAPLPILFLPDDPPEPLAEPAPAPAVAATASTPPLPRPGSTPPITPEEARSFRRPERQKVQLFGASTFIFLALCAFGYYKYDEYKNRPPPPPPKQTAAQQKLKDVPSGANPLAAFKQAKATIDKANQKQLATNSAIHSMDSGAANDPTASIVSGNTTASPRASVVPVDTPAIAALAVVTESRLAAQPTENQVVIDNVAFIAKISDPEIPKPKEPFIKWAQKVRIGGMRLGSTPRVFINNMTYHIGDLVEPQLGIIFDHYDQQRRFLRFKDRTGAMIEIRH
ncbi:hypothetical protein [Oleiharenicola lentus]|uniref:hypothetical protein n=1 Tax=Oleiharenicola lentus TaxID=2508720 RepID=UPI003F6639D0